jgi:CelD/BcsL family acetyltransferase involved in cellulose biosynthesis
VPKDPPSKDPVALRFSRVRVIRDTPEYYLTLPPTWGEFKSRLRRNIKESLRHCYNAPKRDGIVPQFEVVTDRRAVRAALENFFRLHRARASLEGTARHGDVFESAAARRFLLNVGDRFAERGCLRIFRLRIAGATVATRIGFALADSLYLYYSGYDPAFAKYSVMTTVVAEAIQYAIAEKFRTVNLSTGNDVSKTRWGPEERPHREWLVISPSFRGRVVHHLAEQARSFLGRNHLASTSMAGMFSRRNGHSSCNRGG